MVADYIYDLLPATLPKNVGDLPGAATTAVAIIEYSGNPSSEYFGSTLLEPVVKIVVRNPSYAEGKQWVEDIEALLHKYHDSTILSSLVVGSGGVYLGRGETKLHEFQIVFRIQLKE